MIIQKIITYIYLYNILNLKSHSDKRHTHFLFNLVKKKMLFFLSNIKQRTRKISFLTRPTKKKKIPILFSRLVTAYTYKKISKMSSWRKLYRLEKFPVNAAAVT